jgi:hypothetical protein
MREIRPSGSEGGARFNPLSLPYLRWRVLMRLPWHIGLQTKEIWIPAMGIGSRSEKTLSH